MSTVDGNLTFATRLAVISQHGQRIPQDSMMVYAATDGLVTNAADSYKASENVAAAKEETVTLKSAAENQLANAFAAIPKSEELARGVALNVLMCGTLAGALDTSLTRVLAQPPINDTPPIADAEFHAQMKEILDFTTSGAAEQVQQLGKPGVNMMRSMVEEEVNNAAALAGKSDPDSCKAFASHLLHVFQGGYTVGAGSAVLDGHSL